MFARYETVTTENASPARSRLVTANLNSHVVVRRVFIRLATWPAGEQRERE
jgi:hypothetical protein